MYRYEWISKAEAEQHQIDCIQKNNDIQNQWKELKIPGTYATELSDLAMVAIARGCHKDILIFNTDKEAHSPIYTIRAEEYDGGIRDNINPVILAYNVHHYESLAPKTNEDCIRSLKLVESYKKGEYKLGQSDIK